MIMMYILSFIYICIELLCYLKYILVKFLFSIFDKICFKKCFFKDLGF